MHVHEVRGWRALIDALEAEAATLCLEAEGAAYRSDRQAWRAGDGIAHAHLGRRQRLVKHPIGVVVVTNLV